MSLMFTQTQDQAILAFAIKLAAEVATEKRRYVGRTAIQKIMYFLRVRGVPINYNFDIYHYGPFSEQILWDIDWLLADSVIQDKSKNTDKFSNYAPGNNLTELISLHKEKMQEVESTVQSVVKALIPLSPNDLELIATLDYVYRQEMAKGQTGNLKEQVVSRFREIKKDKFTPELVSRTFDMMAAANLISS